MPAHKHALSALQTVRRDAVQQRVDVAVGGLKRGGSIPQAMQPQEVGA